MSIFKSIETLGRLIPIAQILIVLLTAFTIWASVQKGKLEKAEREILSRQVTNTHAELIKSSKELEDIKLKTSPRKLMTEQVLLLEKALSFKSKYSILPACRMMDVEGYDYVQQIAEVFKRANWKVEITNRTFLDDISGDVTIATTNDDQEADASRIANELNKAGIKCIPEKIRDNSISNITANSIVIIVGSKK